jgi:hypothetical protein
MGRPPVDRPTGRKVTLYMLPDVEAKAREIGAGNLSGGVSEAVAAYEPLTISQKAAAVRKAKRKAK